MSAAAKGEGKRREKKHFRENIEAITMAIAVALLFKTFVLEVSKIPSGSMQPTLMGSAVAGVHDRVLVDKLSFTLRDPRRFEIVVFKHPLERSRVMVKRLVGMPEEQLKIEHGDLWRRASPAEPWAVLRRPDAVMEAVWKSIDLEEPPSASWKAVSGEGWRTSERSIEARGDGVARFRPGQPIVDDYADGYPDALRASITAEARSRLGMRGQFDRSPKNHVGDLRLCGEVEVDSGVEVVLLELSEGLRTYEFRLPGPAAASGATAEIRVRDSAAYGAESGSPARAPERVETGPPLRLKARESYRFAVENLDDRLALELDGDVLLAVDVEPAEDQRSGASVGLRGGNATFEDLDLQRDIYYVRQDFSGEVTIPAGHYFFLGDNTLDSADGRDWKAVEYTWRDEDGEHHARGNYRGRGENPREGRNAQGELYRGLRDEWGNVHWFPAAASIGTEPVPAPLVPRHLIQGRALAVFWPILPHRGIWRLGWLR